MTTKSQVSSIASTAVVNAVNSLVSLSSSLTLSPSATQ